MVGILGWGARTREEPASIASKYPAGQPSAPSGSITNAAPSRRMMTSSQWRRSAAGMRTAWLLPLRNTVERMRGQLVECWRRRGGAGRGMVAPGIYDEYIQFPWRRNQIDADRRRPRCRWIEAGKAPANNGALSVGGIVYMPLHNRPNAGRDHSDAILVINLAFIRVLCRPLPWQLIHAAPVCDGHLTVPHQSGLSSPRPILDYRCGPLI